MVGACEEQEMARLTHGCDGHTLHHTLHHTLRPQADILDLAVNKL